MIWDFLFWSKLILILQYLFDFFKGLFHYTDIWALGGSLIGFPVLYAIILSFYPKAYLNIKDDVLQKNYLIISFYKSRKKLTLIKRIWIFCGSLLIVFILSYITHNISKINDPNTALYYLFSSSVQTLAALIGFLVAGYSLLLNRLVNEEKLDDSRESINKRLRLIYFSFIKYLSLLTAFTIVADLLILLLKNFTSHFSIFLITVFIILSISVFLGGISFLINVVKPNTFEDIAYIVNTEMTERLGGQNKNDSQNVKSLEFIYKFQDLINDIQAILKEMNSENVQNFRKMINLMLNAKLIKISIYNKLLELADYRDSVLHTNTSEVPLSIMKQLDEVIRQINDIKNKLQSQNKFGQ